MNLRTLKTLTVLFVFCIYSFQTNAHSQNVYPNQFKSQQNAAYPRFTTNGPARVLIFSFRQQGDLYKQTENVSDKIEQMTKNNIRAIPGKFDKPIIGQYEFLRIDFDAQTEAQAVAVANSMAADIIFWGYWVRRADGRKQVSFFFKEVTTRLKVNPNLYEQHGFNDYNTQQNSNYQLVNNVVGNPLEGSSGWNPGRQNPYLYIGFYAHKVIASYYSMMHPNDRVYLNFYPVSTILQESYGIGKEGLKAIEGIRNKPDITNISKNCIYEIKPATPFGFASSLKESQQYINTFARLNIFMTPCPANDVGTYGILPVVGGMVQFISLMPGSILYTYAPLNFAPNPKDLPPLTLPAPQFKPLDNLKFKFRPLTQQERDQLERPFGYIDREQIGKLTGLSGLALTLLMIDLYAIEGLLTL